MVSHRASRWFSVLSYTVLAVGLVTVLVSFAARPFALSATFAVLLIAAIASENAALPLPRGGTTSLAYPMITAAAMLLGPAAAGVVALSCTVTLRELRRGVEMNVAAINAGQLGLSATLPAWMYVVLGGRILLSPDGAVRPLAAADFPDMLLPLATLGLATFLVNAALVSAGIGLKNRVSPLKVLRSNIAWTFSSYMSLVVLGVAVAQVLTVHPAAFILLVFPLVVSRQLYQRYLVLKGTYLDTVRSLVAALEAKDPYTRGHSERVAEYAASLAEELGLEEREIEQVRMAAQLHDLGKVAIDSELLHKPSQLTAPEYEAIQRHPEVGAEIVARVPELAALTEVVRFHHERWDGTGYAVGLSGDRIPLQARILAIADSYDAMTTARPYREALAPREALSEIANCAGSQFDPSLVGFFIQQRQEVEQR